MVYRNKILKRDKHRCVTCGGGKYLEVHHILPRMMGGNNKFSNLETLCKTCHLRTHLNIEKKFTDEYKRVHSIKTKIGLKIAKLNGNFAGRRKLDRTIYTKYCFVPLCRRLVRFDKPFCDKHKALEKKYVEIEKEVIEEMNQVKKIVKIFKN